MQWLLENQNMPMLRNNMQENEPAFIVKECGMCSAGIIDNGFYCDICSQDNLCESCIGDHECDDEE